MNLTFLQFQASRAPCANLAADLQLDASYFEDENGEPRAVSGFVYSGGAYIENMPDGRYFLLIESEEWISSDLAELERRLYDWCCNQDFWGDYPATVPALADAFARAIRAALTPDQFARVLAHPATLPNCLTHDFIDPNQTAIDVYAEMYGSEDYAFNDALDAIESAWILCRANGWSVSP